MSFGLIILGAAFFSYGMWELLKRWKKNKAYKDSDTDGLYSDLSEPDFMIGENKYTPQFILLGLVFIWFGFAELLK